MKKILSSEVTDYIGKGFKQELWNTKGNDGIRTYTVLTKKNEFRIRIKNFFTVLVKILFSCGDALKDQKTLDQWHFALSKRTVFEVIPPLESEGVTNEPIPIKKPEVKDAFIGKTPPKEMVNYNAPTPTLLELCLKIVAQSLYLKSQTLPAEIANKVLAECSKQNYLNPLAMKSASNADELSIGMDILPDQFYKILENCPHLTTFKFNSFPSCIIENFNGIVNILLKFKKIQPRLTIFIDTGHLDKNGLVEFFLILKANPSFLEAVTPDSRNLVFIDLVKSFKKFDGPTLDKCIEFMDTLSDPEIDTLASSILIDPQQENMSWRFNRLTQFSNLVCLLKRNETTNKVLFEQEDVLVIIKTLLMNGTRYIPEFHINHSEFVKTAFSKLSDEQFKNLIPMFQSTTEDEIHHLTSFLSYSVTNCKADTVLKRIELILEGRDKKGVIKSIFEYLNPHPLPNKDWENHVPPRAELNFYLVWNSIQQDKSYELLKKTLNEFGPNRNPAGENLVFLKLLAEKCDPIHCEGILNAFTRDNYKQGNRDALISLFLNTILSRNNNELIEKAFSAYWKNYPELSGSPPLGTLAPVLPNIKSVPTLLSIIKVIPDDLDDVIRKQIYQEITKGFDYSWYPEYKCSLTDQQIDEAFSLLDLQR